MSIASQIAALTTDRNDIRAALVNQGVSAAANHGFDDFAGDINSLLPTMSETQDSHGGTVLNIGAVDLTQDTVTADKLFYGYTAHNHNGTAITGTYVEPIIPVIEKDVNFIDYDGTLLYSYTSNEFSALTAMPANPTHTGLTAQGWNWTLSDAKTHVATYGKLYIGQVYITSDGKSRFYITIDDASMLSLRLAFGVNGSLTIDWGDNSSTETVTDNDGSVNHYVDHTYASTGNYVISIDSGTSSVLFGDYISGYSTKGLFIQPPTGYWPANNTSYYTTSDSSFFGKILRKIEGGVAFANYRSLTSRTFYGCTNLETVTLPNREYVNSFYYPQYMFFGCIKLKAIVLPDNSGDIQMNMFDGCTSLSAVSLPKTLITINSYAFQNCHSLEHITLPNGVYYIYSNAFLGSGIKDIIIPESVIYMNYCVFSKSHLKRIDIRATNLATWYSQMFSESNGLEEVDLSMIKCATLNGYTFEWCISITSIVLPNYANYEIIGSYEFSHCNSLEHITIPNTVTTINSYAFQYCYSLHKITIPASVNYIGQYAFQYCYSLNEIHFLGTTPPSLSGSSVFIQLPTACKIYVPSGSLSAYTSATNYPSSSTYTYIEE